MSPCPVGIGSLTLRTDTLFTPAPSKRDRSFYLSIYLSIYLSTKNFTHTQNNRAITHRVGYSRKNHPSRLSFYANSIFGFESYIMMCV